MICAVAVGAAPETIEPGLLGTMLAVLVALAALVARAGRLLGADPATLLDAAAQVGQPPRTSSGARET